MINKSWSKISFFKRRLFWLRFSDRGGVVRCGRSLRSSPKTFACARVFVATPLRVFFRAFILYRTHTFVFVFFFSEQTPLFCRGIARASGRSPRLKRCAVSAVWRAGTAIVGWVCPLTLFFVVCTNFHAAAAARLRVRWKFWDIWHISHFPAVTLLIQKLAYLTGSSLLSSGASPLLLPELSVSFADFVWTLLRYY